MARKGGTKPKATEPEQTTDPESIPDAIRAAGNTVPELFRDLHEGRDPEESEDGDPEPENESQPARAAEPRKKSELAQHFEGRDLEHERLIADNRRANKAIEELRSEIRDLKKMSSPEPALPDFENPDPVAIVKWADQRRDQAIEAERAETQRERMKTLYLTEKRMHPDYDALIDKWTATIEGDQRLSARLANTENPFAAAYDIAKELEEIEQARNDGEEEDQVNAREQLRGPGHVSERGRGNEDHAGNVKAEIRELERMFQRTIDPEKFAKQRKFGEQIRAARGSRSAR